MVGLISEILFVQSLLFFQDLLYNLKAKSGIIYHKIKNKKLKSKQPTEFSEDDLKKFLNQCVVSNDRKKLKEKLAESVVLRRRLLKENGDDWNAFFNFYFVDPTLVKYSHSYFKCFFPFVWYFSHFCCKIFVDSIWFCCDF